MTVHPTTEPSYQALRRTLLELATIEEDRAAIEAATVPYWSPCPPSVQAHRLAANALRSAADSFLQFQLADGWT